MKNISLILRVLAVIAAIVATTLFFIGKGILSDKQSELETSRQQTADTQALLNEANETISNLETDLSTERRNLANTKTKLEISDSELHTTKGELARAQQRITDAQAQNAQLENETRRLNKELIDAQEMIAENEGDIEQLNNRIAELQRAKDEAMELANANGLGNGGMNDLNPFPAPGGMANANASGFPQGGGSPSSAGNSISNPTPPAPVVTSAEAVIKSIDIDNGMLVLGSTPDMTFTSGQQVTVLHTNLNAIGSLQITSVEDDLAVGSFLPGAKTRNLEAGSTVLVYR